ncbi:MAG: GTP pyrophosphokinase [Firmicutes bacterium]|nr:GTP pyrophosphokinase [candidate division NPL-UPA2 bacterium]
MDKADLFATLVARVKVHSPQADVTVLRRAFDFAERAHAGQLRESGDEYIGHPIEVALILADIHMDMETLAAAILHDVAEDTESGLPQVTQEFGPRVAKLVDGVTKLSRLEYRSQQEQQAESLRKMFLAMAEDLRVVLIKLADRLHNMRTLKFRAPLKQKTTAKETLDIYAPLAHRLGISSMQWELEDLAFRYLEPLAYRDVAARVAARREDREAVIAEVLRTLSRHISEAGIRADVGGRPKHFYSIYKKLQAGRSFEEIFDLTALRVIVDTVGDCYAVLGIVHNLWHPIPGRIKDYISTPKPNMYQSLHTTVVGARGQPLEFQIRTLAMHQVAEHGIAAHWAYKEGSKLEKGLINKLTWLRSILEWQQELSGAEEFVDGLKMDLFTDEVFVFTPKGDVLDLPVGSVPLDFAYRVHTDVGHRCVGAKVNGRMVPLTHELKTGDIVEIITSKQTNGPSRDWMKLVRTPQARSKIRQWFRKEQKAENIERGHDLLQRELRRLLLPVDEMMVDAYLEEAAEQLNYLSDEDLLAAIGYGAVSLVQVVNRLTALYARNKPLDAPEPVLPPTAPASSFAEVKVVGLDNALLKFAKCCNPLPGDEIIGFVTRGRGVTVHTGSCPNVPSLQREKERMISVSWGNHTAPGYPVRVELIGMDRPGLLAEVVQSLSEYKTNIAAMQARATKEQEAHVSFTIVVKDLIHLERVLVRLRKLRDVFTVRRVTYVTPHREGETSASSSTTS